MRSDRLLISKLAWFATTTRSKSRDQQLRWQWNVDIAHYHSFTSLSSEMLHEINQQSGCLNCVLAVGMGHAIGREISRWQARVLQPPLAKSCLGSSAQRIISKISFNYARNWCFMNYQLISERGEEKKLDLSTQIGHLNCFSGQISFFVAQHFRTRLIMLN